MAKTVVLKEQKKETSNFDESGFNTLQKDVLEHNPTSKNLVMIWKLIHDNLEYPSRTNFFHSLPRKMQYPSFIVALNILELSNFIRVNDNGSVIWTRASPELKKELEKSIDL